MSWRGSLEVVNNCGLSNIFKSNLHASTVYQFQSMEILQSPPIPMLLIAVLELIVADEVALGAMLMCEDEAMFTMVFDDSRQSLTVLLHRRLLRSSGSEEINLGFQVLC
jgi:hypothetical protein